MDLKLNPLHSPQMGGHQATGQAKELTDAQEARQAAILKAAQDFEASYLGITFSSMLADAMPDPEGGHGEEMFRGALANALAKEVAESGGVGIARSIAAQLEVYSK
ncbi:MULTISPECIES: rod-binding protein [Rhodobacterales]|uniref:rod-binding protein n=1 Tax=Roseobacter sp. N2S TaxID=2663844 RepID=UPI002854342E|nr:MULTISPECIES: rod-binding protein [Rhodobacterales]MDR6266762.1 Rod binding domain-containing protein [Roseobacter sp. N2S]